MLGAEKKVKSKKMSAYTSGKVVVPITKYFLPLSRNSSGQSNMNKKEDKQKKKKKKKQSWHEMCKEADAEIHTVNSDSDDDPINLALVPTWRKTQPKKDAIKHDPIIIIDDSDDNDDVVIITENTKKSTDNTKASSRTASHHRISLTSKTSTANVLTDLNITVLQKSAASKRNSCDNALNTAETNSYRSSLSLVESNLSLTVKNNPKTTTNMLDKPSALSKTSCILHEESMNFINKHKKELIKSIPTEPTKPKFVSKIQQESDKFVKDNIKALSAKTRKRIEEKMQKGSRSSTSSSYSSPNLALTLEKTNIEKPIPKTLHQIHNPSSPFNDVGDNNAIKKVREKVESWMTERL